MQFISYIIPIMGLAILCAGWVIVQLIAKRMKTKNHIDNPNIGCGSCDEEDLSNCRYATKTPPVRSYLATGRQDTKKHTCVPKHFGAQAQR